MASRPFTLAYLMMADVLVLASGPLARQASDTPSETDHEAAMKEIQPTRNIMRDSVQKENGDEAASQAAKLVALFTTVESFWTARQTEDAIEFAKAAKAAAASVETAANGNDFVAAGEGVETLAAQCRACHDAYREEVPGGGYRIKEQ